MSSLMIATRIVELLEQRGKTLYWLAKETGTAYSTIHRLGQSVTDGISFRVLDGICEVLDCEPGDVLVRVSDQKQGRVK